MHVLGPLSDRGPHREEGGTEITELPRGLSVRMARLYSSSGSNIGAKSRVTGALTSGGRGNHIRVKGTKGGSTTVVDLTDD